MMASILPSLTSVWHTLRDTGKTCHCIQSRILHSKDVNVSTLHGCSYGRSVRRPAPMTAQRRSEHTSTQIKGQKHSFLASEETAFETLGLQNAVIEALHFAGYSRPSRVQVHMSPHAATGTSTRVNYAMLQLLLFGRCLKCLTVPRSSQLSQFFLDGLLYSLQRLAAGKL